MSKPKRPNSLRGVLWNTFAEADTQFLDLFRVGYAAGLLAFIVLSCWHVYHGGEFKAMEWGAGFGAILFGGGVGVGLRGRYEDGTPTYHQGPPADWFGPRPDDSPGPGDTP